jgi:hypothetical protein
MAATNPDEVLTNPTARSSAGSGGGMPPPRYVAATPKDFGAGYRAMGFSTGGGPTGETAGQHTVQTPQGRSAHGSDVPSSGIPAPEAAAPEAAAGDAAGAGIGAEVGEAALALAPIGL